MGFYKNIIDLFKQPIEREEGEPLINILTRTSGRPVGFNKCYSSVANQSYKNFRHIVSYDTKEDLQYLQTLPIDLVRVKRKKFKGEVANQGHKQNFEPYNLYCNRLLKKVKHGWVMFLDDDDMLTDKKVLADIAEVIENVDDDTLLIWKTSYPDGKEIPDEKAFKAKEIEYMNIDTACFAFHSKFAISAKWDAWRGADYRYIRDLAKVVPHKKWISKIITLKNNFGDQGNRNDLAE